MHSSSPPAPTPAVAINGHDVQVIRFKGDPVVTFAQIDKVHGRVDGTAGRSYRENRDRFIEGDDFVELTQADEIRRLGFERPQGGTPAKVVLITRRGYLKLVKSLNDDVAWAVFDEMVDVYFAAGSARTSPATTALPGPKDVATTFKSYFGIARLIGLDKNQSALAANRATKSTTGVDPIGLAGIELVSPQQAALLTPTDIGIRLGGISAIAVNQLLQARGYQTGRRDGRDRPYWEPTEKGERFATWLDTAKAHHDGTPVRQLKWAAGIVAELGNAAETAAPQLTD